MNILTDEEIKATLENVSCCLEDRDIAYSRAIESAVLAKLEGQLKDAERYQWLKSQEPSKADGYAIGYFDTCGVDAWRMTTKDLDQAIDAAMAKGEQG